MTKLSAPLWKTVPSNISPSQKPSKTTIFVPTASYQASKMSLNSIRVHLARKKAILAAATTLSPNAPTAIITLSITPSARPATSSITPTSPSHLVFQKSPISGLFFGATLTTTNTASRHPATNPQCRQFESPHKTAPIVAFSQSATSYIRPEYS